jgi:hypothetical protein
MGGQRHLGPGTPASRDSRAAEVRQCWASLTLAPTSFRIPQNASRLEAVAERLQTCPLAIEFRHPLWLEDGRCARDMDLLSAKRASNVCVDEPAGVVGGVFTATTGPPSWPSGSARFVVLRRRLGRSLGSSTTACATTRSWAPEGGLPCAVRGREVGGAHKAADRWCFGLERGTQGPRDWPSDIPQVASSARFRALCAASPAFFAVACGCLIVVGALGRCDTPLPGFRAQIYPGTGTDLSLLGRVTTRGFTNGQWGLAFDLGPMQRWWDPESTALLGDVSLGMPWGLTLTGGGSIGSSDTSGIFATLGVDLLRLTVYRRSGDNWWRNTFPAYRPEESR